MHGGVAPGSGTESPAGLPGRGSDSTTGLYRESVQQPRVLRRARDAQGFTHWDQLDSGLSQQIATEMRDGEGDLSPLGGKYESLLQKAVARR